MDANHSARFHLKVLGGFQLYQSDKVVDFPTRKHACLLTRIMHHGTLRRPK